MGARIEVKLEGGEELVAALERMNANVKAELRAAMQAGAQIVRDAARSMAPGPDIEMEVVTATANVVEVAVGPSAKKWYYRFFETGVAPHEIKGKPKLVFEGRDGLVVASRVQHPGMAARPFLRPAMDANESAATDAIGARLRSTVEAGV